MMARQLYGKNVWLVIKSNRFLDNPTNLGTSDFSAVAATLDTNNSLKFLDGIDPTIKIGTGAVRPSYVMLSSTELQPDFDALVGSGFKNQWDYSANLTALMNEYGNIYNIRVLTSAEAPVLRGASLGSRDVYLNIVAGKQGVTHIGQTGDSMQLLYRGPEFSGMLMQNVTLAIRFPQAQALTQDTAVRVLRCTSASNFGVF
jgi:N4-gp56 family major capsid protein